LLATPAAHYKPGMKRRNRTLLIIGVVATVLGWLAWKTLLTANTLPSTPPVAREPAR
jgi:hypothetical protein